MELSGRFFEAMQFAGDLHSKQIRKCTGAPFLAYPMGVASTVLEWGGDEDTSIAALLLNAVEDQGGLPTLNRIRETFGDKVAGIVEACSDSLVEDPAQQAPWIVRKSGTVARLANVDQSTALVVLADKLYNARAMLSEAKRFGEGFMKKFGSSGERRVWFFHAVGQALERYRPDFGVLLDDLESATRDLAKGLNVDFEHAKRLSVSAPVESQASNPGSVAAKSAFPERRAGSRFHL